MARPGELLLYPFLRRVEHDFEVWRATRLALHFARVAGRGGASEEREGPIWHPPRDLDLLELVLVGMERTKGRHAPQVRTARGEPAVPGRRMDHLGLERVHLFDPRTHELRVRGEHAVRGRRLLAHEHFQEARRRLPDAAVETRHVPQRRLERKVVEVAVAGADRRKRHRVMGMEAEFWLGSSDLRWARGVGAKTSGRG